ncbi:MAG: LemA family protein [Candidatus Cloacimonetes bacterium]|nr:LemA family protein [Candidatus Cloacimonadota bacterium]
MKKGWIIALVIIGIIVLGLLGTVATVISRYNNLQKLVVAVDNGWSEVENQLNRRFDLIPNLVETVKGYASHEREVLTEVTESRSKVGSAQTPADKIEANNQLSSALSRLMVVVERYPDLKANTNFMMLQDELAGTENRIAVARRRYNESVNMLNQSIVVFPNNMLATMFNIEKAEFFKAPVEAQKAPEVKF